MKRGAALPIETVIILIISLVVLLLVLMFVTGKWSNLTDIFGGLEGQITTSADETSKLL